MKLVIFLAAVALSGGAKLDRNYLPPSHAQTSGGSGNFLQTPISGSTQDYQGFQALGNNKENVAQNNGAFAQNVDNYAQGGQSGNDYDQNFTQGGNSFEQSGSGFAQSGNGFNQNDFGSDEARPERPQASFERNAAILRFDNANDGETYAYAYETENGIIAEENGVATNGVEAQGGYSYTGDDGKVYSIRYTADQNGFQPQGEHIPTPPPIPEEILKALEQNALDEANGIFDDGTYNEAKYGDSENDQQNNNYKNEYNYNNGNSNNFNAGGDFSNQGFSGNDEDSVVTNNALIRSNDEQAQAGFGNRNAQAGFGQNTAASFGNQNTQAAYNNQNTQAIFRNQNNQATFGNQVAQADSDNQNTQATFGSQKKQATFGNQYTQAAFRQNSQSFNQNGLQKAYLPPTNVQRGQGRYQPNNSFRSPNGLEKSYLPPQQFGQRAGQNGGRYNQRNGLRNGGIEKAYLPPFSQGQSQNGQNQIAFDQQPQNFRGQVANQSNRGTSREYLPPSSRSNGRGRRPSVDAKNGYQY